jgi:hypothetical protein
LNPFKHKLGSADFESAGSQNCILQRWQEFDSASQTSIPADYQSAMRQIQELRYLGDPQKHLPYMRVARVTLIV